VVGLIGKIGPVNCSFAVGAGCRNAQLGGEWTGLGCLIRAASEREQGLAAHVFAAAEQ
jgi:hypothetical protein